MPDQMIEMRIIAGKYRHRKIFCPLTDEIRPTKDRIKEAIFSAIGSVENKVFLDLYAGSGSMGIEAISRGTRNVYFNDLSRTAMLTIRKNLRDLNVDECYELSNVRDVDVIRNIQHNNKKVDVVFMDPPYEKGEYINILKIMYESNIIADDAIIVCESNRDIDELPFSYKTHKRYSYGPIIVNIYWR